MLMNKPYVQVSRFLFTLVLLVSLTVLTAPLAFASSSDWPMYLNDATRNSANLNESTLSTSNVSKLTQQWVFHTGGIIASSATVVNGVVYFGSWDGYEYAINESTGQQVWKTFLGITTNSNCTNQTSLGVTSSASVVNGVVYVGGGDGDFYALDANSGAVDWNVKLGDNSAASGHYVWSSPLIYNNNAYIGIASQCDIPLVQGQIFKIDLATHAIAGTFSTVPDGQVGAGIWSSPSVDPSTNTIFITTGNGSSIYSQAMIALDASTFAVKGSWQIPADQLGPDSDWGTTPLVASLSDGTHTVSAINKNGILYDFFANNVSAGPIWQTNLAVGGDCPECGDGSISSGTFNGSRLFYAAGNTTINGTSYKGSLRALDPHTGSIVWQNGFSGTPFSAVAYANGIIAVAPANSLQVLNAQDGTVLFNQSLSNIVYGAPSIANGMIFVGTIGGNEYAFSLGSQPPPTTTTLGGLNLTAYCQSLGQNGSALNGSTWICNPSGNTINMTGACVWQYNNSTATAAEARSNDPYSWTCYSTK